MVYLACTRAAIDRQLGPKKLEQSNIAALRTARDNGGWRACCWMAESPYEIGMALRQIVEMEGGVEGEVVGVVM